MSIAMDTKLWPQSPSPWLVYTHGNKSKKIQTFCTISPLPPHNNQQSYVKKIPELCGKQIVGSFDDWLLLRDLSGTNIFSLYNIVTLEQICLPKFSKLYKKGISISSCALNNGVIFLFCEAQVFYCRFRRSDKTGSLWFQQNIKVDGEKINYVRAAVTCNGVLYAEDTTSDKFFTIEFKDHDSNLIVFKSVGLQTCRRQLLPSPVFQTYLLESNGGLYKIIVTLEFFDYYETSIAHQILKVEIWECDLCRMIWVPVKCLGNRAFFLGWYSSTWCWATDQSSTSGGFEGDCVYIISQGSKIMYSYKLKDDTFTFLAPSAKLTTPFYGPVWVMPSHQRLLMRTEVGDQIVEKVDILDQRTNFIVPNMGDQSETQEDLVFKLADLIPLISKDMYLFDYMNFRASCKTIKSVLPASPRRVKNPFPLFMFSKGGNGLCELRDISRSGSLSIMIPNFPIAPTRFEFSKDGWLVVWTGEKSLQFFNPFTRVKGKFPPHEYTLDFASFGFSTCPTSSECLAVGFINSMYNVLIFSLKSGEETWQRYIFDHEDVRFIACQCSPVYHKGAFYFMCQSGNLGEFKITSKGASWKVYSTPHTGCDTLQHSRHLVECGGELLSVLIGQVGCLIQVFKFNHSENKWDKLETLGNHILFIGYKSSFSELVGDSIIKDRIYLPWRMDDGIVYYSLEDGKYHALGTDEVRKDFYGMQRQSLCCWV